MYQSSFSYSLSINVNIHCHHKFLLRRIPIFAIDSNKRDNVKFFSSLNTKKIKIKQKRITPLVFTQFQTNYYSGLFGLLTTKLHMN